MDNTPLTAEDQVAMQRANALGAISQIMTEKGCTADKAASLYKRACDIQLTVKTAMDAQVKRVIETVKPLLAAK